NTPLDFMRAVAPESRLRLLARDREPGILRKIVNPLLRAVEEARDAGR
ncbi:MAG: hypothetical protein QOG57_251, partial [Pseudonocardiales bacterium]|nr:hypothetical protein [Pseudonocardiales bacterium]